MEFDLEHREAGHLLQLLYALHAALLGALRDASPDLLRVLQRCKQSELPGVAQEADAALALLQAREPLKPGALLAEEVPAGILPEVPEVEFRGDASGACEVSLRVGLWGLRYGEAACWTYVESEGALLVLYSNVFAPQAAAEFASVWNEVERASDACWSVYWAEKELVRTEGVFSYEAVLDTIWRNQRNPKRLLIEEDLLENAELIVRELQAVDQTRGGAAVIDPLGTNSFTDCLQWRAQLLRSAASSPDAAYLLDYDLEVAYQRSEELYSDAVIAQRVADGDLPVNVFDAYPEPYPCDEEGLTAEDWQWDSRGGCTAGSCWRCGVSSTATATFSGFPRERSCGSTVAACSAARRRRTRPPR